MMDAMATAKRRANLQWNHHHQQTNTQLSTGQMPFLSPNQQCQSTEAKTEIYSNKLQCYQQPCNIQFFIFLF